MTWRPSASRRREPSTPESRCASATRSANHSSSAPGPSRSRVAASCSSSARWRRSVSRRSPPLLPEQPGRDVAVAGHGLHERGHPARLEHAPPAPDLQRHVDHRVVVRTGELDDRPAEEARQGGGADVALGRRVERDQERRPVLRGLGHEDGPVRPDDRRHARGDQGGPDVLRGAVGPHQDGDVAGVDRARAVAEVDLRARGQQPGDVGDQVAGDAPAHDADGVDPRACRRRRRTGPPAAGRVPSAPGRR